MSGNAKRSLMQVEPAKLVELAESSESILGAMVADWRAVADDLGGACAALGDAAGTVNVVSSYADSLADAGEVVTALAHTLGLGVAGLVDAARDAVRADDTVVEELARAAHGIGGDLGSERGCGGR